MTNKKLCKKIISWEINSKPEISKFGELMFRMFSEKGLPPEITMDYLKEKRQFTNEETAQVFVAYQKLFTEHQLKSGVKFDGRNHDKIRERNKQMIKNILEGNDYD